MVDELSSRRSRFQPGTPICLANGQEWTLPGPTADSEFAVEGGPETEYLGLIHAIMEAEDQSDRRRAELVLVIFLIGLNYQLSSTDLANLFTFQPRSREPRHALSIASSNSEIAPVNDLVFGSRRGI